MIKQAKKKLSLATTTVSRLQHLAPAQLAPVGGAVHKQTIISVGPDTDTDTGSSGCGQC